MEERTQNVGALADEQHGSRCAMAHEVCRAGVATCVVFLPVKIPSAVAEAVGENMGSPALSVGREEQLRHEPVRFGPAVEWCESYRCPSQ